MILFLDFDGTLHSLSREFGVLSQLPQFEKVMREFPDVQIVISSAWRTDYTLPAIRSFFSDDIGRRIIDVTPCLDSVLTEDGNFHLRQVEIERWLAANGREKEAWVALDDATILFPDGSRNLVWVDGERGFNDSTEIELRRRLNEKETQKVLLLDFDGILHPSEVYLIKGRAILKAEGELFMWAPILVEALKPFPGVHIVLSTSWVRIKGFNRAKRHLPPELSWRVIGSTYHSYMCGIGFAEMTRYRQIAGHVARMEIVHWLALDVDDNGWPHEMMHRLVCPNGNFGLSDSKVIEELQGKSAKLGESR